MPIRMWRITTFLNDLSKANRNRNTFPTKSFLNLVDIFRDVNYDERVDFVDFVVLSQNFCKEGSLPALPEFLSA